MSIRIEHRIGIAATPEKVWDVIADLERWGDWNPLHPEASGHIAIGGRLELAEALDGDPARRLEATIPDWTPEIQLVWNVRRGFLSRSTRYFELESLTDHSTLLANGEIFDGLLGEDWAAKRRASFRAAFEAINEAIKARAEAA